jgi:hypothetical protein
MRISYSVSLSNNFDVLGARDKINIFFEIIDISLDSVVMDHNRKDEYIY